MAAQACSGSSHSVAQTRTLCCCRLHSFPRISPDAVLEGRARAGRIRAWEGVFKENAVRSQSVSEDAALCGAEIFPGVLDSLQPLTLLPTHVGCWGSLGGSAMQEGLPLAGGTAPSPTPGHKPEERCLKS